MFFRNFRQRRALLLESALAILVIGFSVWFVAFRPGDPIRPSTSRLSFVAPPDPNAVSHSGSTESHAGPTIRNRPTQPAEKQTIKANEQKVILSTLLAVKTTLEEPEKANSTTVLDKEFPESYQTAIRMTPPTAEQQAAAYDQLSSGLNQLGDNVSAAEDLRNGVLKMVMKYASFPKKMKVLTVLVPKDASRPTSILEFNADDEKFCLPDENGALLMPAQKDATVHGDDDYGGKDSWAAKRYSHLILINR